jgi:D-alanyl-lipoteichoic acid acyltransferase DltB (MBOAT superfamily)
MSCGRSYQKEVSEMAKVQLISYGFFKKVVIADRLAVYVNEVFDNIEDANTISLLFGAVFFSIQIYCDFSGYSLIARGTAKLLGFELMVNFRRPYLAANIPDFWRRWHISLSTWFKDYLYIPLGGNRVGKLRNYGNIMIVFLVSGFWHGANWTFVLWGGLHGVFQVVYLAIKDMRRARSTSVLHKILSILFVYTVVCFAWIFFRAESLSDAILYLEGVAEMDLSLNLARICAYKGPLNLGISLLVIGLLGVSYLLPQDLKFKKYGTYLAVNVGLLYFILLLGVNGKNDFIYFQF